jgi:galactokinase
MSRPETSAETDRRHQFLASSIRNRFRSRFGRDPLLVRSPGRINLIGEHTDYNSGFVMPAAIDRQIVIAIQWVDGTDAILYSVKHDETVHFDMADPRQVQSPFWSNYLLGVARQFVDRGYPLKPFACIIDGDIPTGAGLSSSAALECGFAFALNYLHDHGLPRQELIYMAQWAEHHFVGVKCGIMDQFASMMGCKGKAFVLDCRSLTHTYFPMDLKVYSLVLCDTMVKHSLASTAYNTRRTECEQGVALLQQYYPEIDSLRDVTIGMLEEHQHEFTDEVYARCTYVVSENIRVLAAADDLKRGDLEAFGEKMYATHDGLSTQYAVSCAELDFLVDRAKIFDGVLGARMMGGGFGGCTLNIVHRDKVNDFLATVGDAYRDRFKHDMDSYIVAIEQGTSAMTSGR